MKFSGESSTMMDPRPVLVQCEDSAQPTRDGTATAGELEKTASVPQPGPREPESPTAACRATGEGGGGLRLGW